MKRVLSVFLVFILMLGIMLPISAMAATDTARNYLSATSGGSISWAQVTTGAAKIGTVSAGGTIEFAGYYELPAGSSVSLTATPASGYTFKGWYTQWNSTSPNLVSSSVNYTWTLPTDAGTELTAAFESAGSSAETVDMRVWTPGHGKVMVNGSDYGTEFQGTWYEGTEVQVEAVPDPGYRFDYWWLSKAAGGGDRVTTASTTVTAGTHTEAVAAFGLVTATLTITAPAAGQTAATKPQITLPSGAGYSIESDSMWEPGLSWLESAAYDAAVLDSTATFEAGQTYYAKVRLRDDGAGFAATAGGSTFNTDLSVTGGEKQWQSNSANTNEVSPGTYEVYIAIEAVIAVTVPEANGVADAWVDNTVDNSVSYVTGMVYITGTGGTQAGYNADGTGKTVYSNQANVTYSNPRTSQVEGMINDTETQVYTLANACKRNGSGGEFHMSTSESTGRVWDNRVYKTFTYNNATSQWEYTSGSGDTEVYTGEIPSNAGTNTRIHVASGDYGKETYYRVEANGWVSGYTITVTDDGNGTASADLEASLAGETVTLTATPASGYMFKEWQVISGDVTLTGDSFTMPAADIEIKALFESAVVTYTVTFDANGGTGEMPAVQVNAGDKLTLPENGFTAPEGKEFDTWDAGAPGTQITITGDTVIKAQWKDAVVEPEIYNVTFDANGGTGEMPAVQVNTGDKLTLPENGFTAPEGKEFDTWDAGAPGTQIEISADTTIKAIWKEQQNVPVEINYDYTQGDGATWTKGSTLPLEFTVKGSPDDTNTFSHFTGIEVDGSAVASDNYTAVAGSVKITLKAAYLETLSVGSHSLKAIFTDGSAVAKFTVKAKETPVDPGPGSYDYKFTFTKLWQGDAEKSIDWTLYDGSGNIVHKGFNKKVVSDTEWHYEAWFASDADYYIVENVPAGYKVRYENVGAHAGETDRCYNGGTIINYKVPKTGDNANLVLWLSCVLLGVSAVCGTLVFSRRKKENR